MFILSFMTDSGIAQSISTPTMISSENVLEFKFIYGTISFEHATIILELGLV